MGLIKFGSKAEVHENLDVIDGEVVAQAATREAVERGRQLLGVGNYTKVMEICLCSATCFLLSHTLMVCWVSIFSALS